MWRFFCKRKSEHEKYHMRYDKDIERKKEKPEKKNTLPDFFDHLSAMDNPESKKNNTDISKRTSYIDKNIMWRIYDHIFWKICINDIRSLSSKKLHDSIWSVPKEKSLDWGETFWKCIFHKYKSRIEREPFFALMKEEVHQRNWSDKKNREKCIYFFTKKSFSYKKEDVHTEEKYSYHTFCSYDAESDNDEKYIFFSASYESENNRRNHKEKSCDIIRISESARTSHFPPTSFDSIGSTSENIISERFDYCDKSHGDSGKYDWVCKFFSLMYL